MREDNFPELQDCLLRLDNKQNSVFFGRRCYCCGDCRNRKTPAGPGARRCGDIWSGKNWKYKCISLHFPQAADSRYTGFMKLAEVVPITSSLLHKRPLSYFTTKHITTGSLVTVPLARKIVPALVTSVSEVRSHKSTLRQSDFALKKIDQVLAQSFLTTEFIKSVNRCQKYFIAASGQLFKQLIPGRILQKGFHGTPLDKRLPSYYRTSIFQGAFSERMQNYKSIIREAFAEKRSVFLIVPAVYQTEEMFHVLQKGIEDYTILIHGNLGARDFDQIWERAAIEPHPLLFIGTAMTLSAPRNDIGIIIIEHEGSVHYKTRRRPLFDIRKMAEELGRQLECHVILGDEVVRTETYVRKEEGVSSSSFDHSLRSQGMVKKELIRLHPHKDFSGSVNPKKEFLLFGGRAEELLREYIGRGRHTLLFINRRGHSTAMICRDCGKMVQCAKCDAPLVFHVKQGNLGEERLLLCHHCLTSITVSERCPSCKSWRFGLFGVGIQRAYEEIVKLFSETPVFRLDSDVVKTKKQGEEVVGGFFAAHGGILLATEFIFSFLRRPVDLVGVISVDALFALPDFRMNERIFSLLIALRNMAREHFFIQTRLAAQTLFDDVLRGNLANFYRRELEFRKYFRYPPFTMMIKITREEKSKEALEHAIVALERRLASYSPVTLPAFIGKVDEKYRSHLMLRLEQKTWPEEHESLRQFLAELSPRWTVEVDPESLL